MLNLAARNPFVVESMGDEALALAKRVMVNEKRIRMSDANRRMELRRFAVWRCMIFNLECIKNDINKVNKFAVGLK